MHFNSAKTHNKFKKGYKLRYLKYHRSLDTRICEMDIEFRAVLGSRGYRKKTAVFMLLFRLVFQCFHGQKTF